MPFAVGALFLIPFVVAVWLLDQLPEPTAADVAARSLREPMDRRQRLEFLRRFLPGLLGLFAGATSSSPPSATFATTSCVDLFTELDYPYEQNKSIVTRSGLWIGLGVAAVDGDDLLRPRQPPRADGGLRRDRRRPAAGRRRHLAARPRAASTASGG